jgi:AcrR family transcriptional regulator
VTPPPATRKTADERRDAVIQAALGEFADKGLHGASTDAIARAAGISQPYLFRLFGTKKELFIATVQRCLDETLARFREASRGLTGGEAVDAMGRAYVEWITGDARSLRAQLQAYSACEDPEIADTVRRGFGRLVSHVEETGVTPERVNIFFARGMLMNVIAAMDLGVTDAPWAQRLVASCGRQHDAGHPAQPLVTVKGGGPG